MPPASRRGGARRAERPNRAGRQFAPADARRQPRWQLIKYRHLVNCGRMENLFLSSGAGIWTRNTEHNESSATVRGKCRKFCKSVTFSRQMMSAGFLEVGARQGFRCNTLFRLWVSDRRWWGRGRTRGRHHILMRFQRWDRLS